MSREPWKMPVECIGFGESLSCAEGIRTRKSKVARSAAKSTVAPYVCAIEQGSMARQLLEWLRGLIKCVTLDVASGRRSERTRFNVELVWKRRIWIRFCWLQKYCQWLALCRWKCQSRCDLPGVQRSVTVEWQ